MREIRGLTVGAFAVAMLMSGCIASPAREWQGTETGRRHEVDVFYRAAWDHEPVQYQPGQERCDRGPLYATHDAVWDRYSYKADSAPNRVLSTGEFERLGGGVCKDWAWWYHVTTLRMGYDSRYVVGWMNGQWHAWTVIYMEPSIVILDVHTMTADMSAYRPLRSYQGALTWTHTDDTRDVASTTRNVAATTRTEQTERVALAK